MGKYKNHQHGQTLTVTRKEPTETKWPDATKSITTWSHQVTINQEQRVKEVGGAKILSHDLCSRAPCDKSLKQMQDQRFSLHLVVESHSNLSILSINNFLGDFPRFSFNPCLPYELLCAFPTKCNFHTMEVYKCSTLSPNLQVIVLYWLVLYQFQ